MTADDVLDVNIGFKQCVITVIAAVGGYIFIKWSSSICSIPDRCKKVFISQL